MKTYRGKRACGGIAIGKIRMIQRGESAVKCYHITDTEKESMRFEQARRKALEQLKHLYRKAFQEVGASGAAIFEAHQMLLRDEAYLNLVNHRISTRKENAEYAVVAAGEEISARFAAMEDVYMRERAADVEDLSHRILSILHGKVPVGVRLDEPSIVIADDLSPSETMQLDREKILAFVTVRGSVNSHTAILAGSMGIPALIGTDVPADDNSLDGLLAVVDAQAGYIYVDPDEETLQRMRRKREQEEQELLRTRKNKKNVTLDGKEIFLSANISDEKEVAAAIQGGADGIGLFRSECLYLGKEDYPTENEQFQVYKTIVEAMAGKPVVIRTLDIGGDKKASYFGLAREENPAMGCRGIRIRLIRPNICRTQIRALLRASAYGDLSILYPMITSVKEVQDMKRIVEEVKQELECEKLPVGRVEQGIMIETPAAAMISDLLAKEVDFFSIGTNDLTQYMLAADRKNQMSDVFYDARHPAVFRAIRQTVQNAHQAGIRCGICGELGADTELTALFLALGIDGLSVSAGNILPVRKQIQETDVEKEKETLLEKWL